MLLITLPVGVTVVTVWFTACMHFLVRSFFKKIWVGTNFVNLISGSVSGLVLATSDSPAQLEVWENVSLRSIKLEQYFAGLTGRSRILLGWLKAASFSCWRFLETPHLGLFGLTFSFCNLHLFLWFGLSVTKSQLFILIFLALLSLLRGGAFWLIPILKIPTHQTYIYFPHMSCLYLIYLCGPLVFSHVRHVTISASPLPFS